MADGNRELIANHLQEIDTSQFPALPGETVQAYMTRRMHAMGDANQAASWSNVERYGPLIIGGAAAYGNRGGSGAEGGGGGGTPTNTGGSSSAPGGSSMSNFIGQAGRVLTGIEGGRAAGRQQEFDNALQSARLNLEAPGMRARNAVRGDVLANAQPVTIKGPIVNTHGQIPQISGGLSPALFSPNTRQLGQQMSRDALLSQMSPTVQSPQANGLDTALNIGGAAGLIGGLSSFWPKKPPPIPTLPDPQPGNPMLPYQPPSFPGWGT